MNESKSKKQWTAEDVIYLQNLISTLNVQSLNIPMKDESGDTFSELGDFIIDVKPGPQEILEENELKSLLLKYVNELSPRQQIVIEQRYGLLDGKPKTLDNVGKIFGVTRERIRQIETNALKRLKWLLIAKGKYTEFKGGD